MESTTDYYDMDKPGKALILNHSKFEIPGVQIRNGTEYDVEKLKSCIEKLNFSTVVYNDLPLRKIRRVLRRETHHLNKNKISCFMMVVLTHGKSEQLYARDHYYDISELWENFRPPICTKLEGVPKLFFIQACRGNMSESVQTDELEYDDTSENHLVKSPAQADFLHYYSTCPGYKSLRMAKRGSPFIQSICEVFDEYGTKMDLMDLTLKINDLVIRKCQKANSKQVPELSCKLRKRLRFIGINEIEQMVVGCNDPVIRYNETRDIAIGINLSSYTSAAFVKDGKPEICKNIDGATFIPGWVWFGDGDFLTGEEAKNKSIEDMNRVIFDTHRLLGRNIDDEAIQEDRKKWPFDLVEESGQLQIKIKINGEEKLIYPHDISGMVLVKMKKCAEDQIGKSVKYAVITVPAYFNYAQRHATINAGNFAGLKVLGIIKEPTAAAFAYNLKPELAKDKKTILVYDLGGRTFEVSILKISGQNMIVMATKTDNHLGGEDFCNNLVNHCIKRFEYLFDCNLVEINQVDAKVITCRLKSNCESAKIELSIVNETTIKIDSIYEGNNFMLDISRARFEYLNNDLFKKTIDLSKICLEDAYLTSDQIDNIILVGGSTRMPKVKEILSKEFPRSKLLDSLNPNQTVVQGAAIYADTLLKSKLAQVRNAQVPNDAVA